MGHIDSWHFCFVDFVERHYVPNEVEACDIILIFYFTSNLLKTKFASDIYERRKISTNRLWKDTRSRTIYRLMRNTRGKSSSGYVLLREFKGVKDPDQNITLWRIKRSSTFRFTLKSSINIINSTKRLILIVKHYTKPTMFVYMVNYPIIDDLHIWQNTE